VEKATGRLIAGECRLRAHRLLGLPDIEVTYKEDLDEWTIRMIELEENIRRENLTYAEEVEAKLQLHELYQEKFGKTVEGQKGGHRLVDTAAILGEAEGLTKMDVALARAIRLHPALAEKGTKSAAYKAMKSEEELSLRTAIAAILTEDAQTQGVVDVQVVLGDSLPTLSREPDNSFDFCVTDPPWGVNVDASVNLEEGWSEVRVDEERGLGEQEEVFHEVYRVLREGAHCYVFFASLLQQETYDMLTRCGFTVRSIPLIWHKTRSGNIDAAHRFTSSYEPIFFCHKGKPKTFGLPGLEDVLTFPTPSLKVHPTQKPEGVVEVLVENCSVEGERGLDPYAGSGVFGKVCKRMGRRALLIEMDKEYYTHAWEAVNQPDITPDVDVEGEEEEESDE
jgi:site-specific DNA-methyltransferase (adenine-specific)